MENRSLSLNNKNLTYNNIEKIKKSIDCLKATIKRSNSHLYLNGANPIKIMYNQEIQKTNSPINYTPKLTYNQSRINTISSLNKSSTLVNKNIFSSSPGKSNNISFYNINITNTNNKKYNDSIGNLYKDELSYINKYNKSNNFINFRNKGAKILNNTKNYNNICQINQEKIKDSINELENINKDLKEKYKNIIQKYKSTIIQNKKLIREKSEINIKLKDIKGINSKIKNKIEDMKLKKKNKDLEKNKTDLSEKNKDLKIKIEQKDKIIFDLKKKLNEIINGENNFDNSNDIINYNNIIEDLKNKITQINKEIYKQEEAIKLL